MVRELEGEVGVHYIIYNYVQYLQYKFFILYACAEVIQPLHLHTCAYCTYMYAVVLFTYLCLMSSILLSCTELEEHDVCTSPLDCSCLIPFPCPIVVVVAFVESVVTTGENQRSAGLCVAKIGTHSIDIKVTVDICPNQSSPDITPGLSPASKGACTCTSNT